MRLDYLGRDHESNARFAVITFTDKEQTKADYIIAGLQNIYKTNWAVGTQDETNFYFEVDDREDYDDFKVEYKILKKLYKASLT